MLGLMQECTVCKEEARKENDFLAQDIPNRQSSPWGRKSQGVHESI